MAYDLDAEQDFTRGIATPNGDYLITLPGKFWNALDWMNAETNWNVEHTIRVAWKAAKQTENDGTMNHPGNFQKELTDSLKVVIHYRFQLFGDEERGVANVP